MYKPKVIIIGAGYAGLITALKLSQLNIDCLLLEKKTADTLQNIQSRRLFSIATSSVELLQSIGVDAVTKLGQEISHIRVWDYNSDAIVDFDPTEIGCKAFGYMIIESEVMQALYQAAAKQSNIVMEFGVSDCKIQNLETKIAVQWGEQIRYGDLLIIANGRNSNLLRKVGLTRYTKDYHQYGLVCEIKHEHHHYGVAVEQFMPGGPFAILPQKGGYNSSLVWTVSEEIGQDIKNFSEEQMILLLKQIMNRYLGQIQLNSKIQSFPLKLEICKQYFANRVVVVGDAAHSIHPIAGQGLNLAIEGIRILSDNIKSGKELGLDIGSQYVIQQYSRQHQFNVNMMVESTDILNTLFNIEFLPVKILRRFGMSAFNKIPTLKKAIMKYATKHQI